MKVDVLMDEEDIVIYPRCQVDDCEQEVRSVTYVTPELPVTAMDQYTTKETATVANPCGHTQPSSTRLVWVTRDSEPDCGM